MSAILKRRAGRPKGPSTDSQQARRELILGEAAALFAEQGYAASTMDELAERLQLNKATLYYYYRAKSDLLYELALQANQQAVEIAQKSADRDTPAEQLSSFIDAMVEWVYANRNIAQIFIMEQNFFGRILDPDQFNELARIQRSYMRLLYGMISEGVESQAFALRDVVTAGRSISTILFNVATWKATSLSAQAVADQMKLLFLEGLTPSPR
ncbi:MAG: TetR/AcrR family transcriptional regulator [Phenylobacterium sp.]|uniref:TetR/AcrR family transcriptional regulator n=1 Tax=Phenylobacterium sp. TaxID=1871053 RepID=UPI002736AA1D|nr:TetR/AcrR family transcriptional regulator [Phenylobacterium sp.]MDP3750019.1 TetR/AcrR family transcriptional regulator [Phenylobacterium sp.]